MEIHTAAVATKGEGASPDGIARAMADRGQGSARRVFEAACASLRAGRAPVLALVLETEGSTYADAGAMALFDGDDQAGWLSGGCLEPEIAHHAAEAAGADVPAWLELDTRDDEDLLSGSAPGCRGRLRLLLLPLRGMSGIEDAIDAWLGGGATMLREVDAQGRARLAAGAASAEATWAAPAPPWAGTRAWRLPLPPPPELLVLGTGPETASLLPLLRDLGWRTRVAERRERWRGAAAGADVHLDAAPAVAIAQAGEVDAVLVMHHHFELDREALAALAGGTADFVGLLGPARRREDLFRLLSPAQRESLAPRLRSPVGLHLGGKSPAGIALSIAAQLQAWWHGARTR